MMAFLLDTNHCIYLKNGSEKPPDKRTESEKNVCQFFSTFQGGNELFISEVTFGELCFGAAKSQNPKKNKIRVEHLRMVIQTLPVNEDIWREFGIKKAALQRVGKSLSDFDCLIACTAHVHGLILITHDQDFEVLGDEYLSIESWA